MISSGLKVSCLALTSRLSRGTEERRVTRRRTLRNHPLYNEIIGLSPSQLGDLCPSFTRSVILSPPRPAHAYLSP